jgi:hypothetical protein
MDFHPVWPNCVTRVLLLVLYGCYAKKKKCEYLILYPQLTSNNMKFLHWIDVGNGTQIKLEIEVVEGPVKLVKKTSI